MTNAQLPTPPPRPTVETEEFWSATAAGRLLLKRCDDCDSIIWYPRGLCPACGSLSNSWIEAAGRGTVYTFTIVRRAQGPFGDASPYVVAYVELEEGPRVMTNIVDCPVEAVAIGMPVEVVFHDTGEGSALYRFRPA